MNKEVNKILQLSKNDDDPTAAARKKDHIELAFKSQIDNGKLDERFYYEPLLAAHPRKGSLKSIVFLGKKMKAPIWVSSMTGGTAHAKNINHNLARACKDYGIGMGLGSCRSLLHSDEYLSDFNVRSIMGDDCLLFANLGIAQLEQLIDQNQLYLANDLVNKLQADGLIIHVNPLQEWLQPEGDVFKKPPIETIQRTLDYVKVPVIVKEVGQGMGKSSLKTLFQLPLAAIDFAASGGTNFSKLEMLRSQPLEQEVYGALAYVGHNAEEMVRFSNEIIDELQHSLVCKQVIISGGIKNFLDGYYLINKLAVSSIYGQASGFLKHACGSYEDLQVYVESQIRGLELANAFLSIRQ